jgi:hypothetical protein
LHLGPNELRVDLAAGFANLDKPELAALMDAFLVERGRWELVPERFAGDKREAVPLARIALDGVRRLLRELPLEDLEAALGERLHLAPRVRPDQEPITKRMGLSQRELRFLEMHLDGASDSDHLASHAGMARGSVLGLFALLELFDVLAWAPPVDDGPLLDPAAEVAAEAERLARANYFEVLGVHWSAGDEELQTAYGARRARYAPGSPLERHNRAACKTMRERVEAAYAALRHAEQRANYRRVALQGQDFDAVAELEHKRSSTLAMRGDARAAAQSERAAKELQKSIDERRAAELQQRAMRTSTLPSMVKPDGPAPKKS